MDRTAPDELFEFLSRYPSAMVELFLEARSFLFGIAPDCTELVNDAGYTVACGFTYTHTFPKEFMHIAISRDHVNLGFDYGVDLDDPESRLRGEGVRMRHLHLHSPSDLSDSYVASLVRDAEAKAFRPAEPMPPITVVKVLNKKRKPSQP